MAHILVRIQLKQADEALQVLAQLPPNSQRQAWGLASVRSLLF